MIPEIYFSKGLKKREYDLEGKTLFVQRYKGPYESLYLRLVDVGIVKFSIQGNKQIHVEVFNTKKQKIAYFEEFKKTKSVMINKIETMSEDHPFDNEYNETHYEYMVER